MTTKSLFHKTLGLIVVLFAIILLSLSIFSAYSLRSHLTNEFISKGHSIAKSVSDSSVEVLLNRDASTIQAVIDQAMEITGVGYVFVANADGEIISHTFVPKIPDKIFELLKNYDPIQKIKKPKTILIPRRQGFSDISAKGKNIRDMVIPQRGEYIDISVPILEGVVGEVHVGMARVWISENIQNAVFELQAIMLIIFLISVMAAYFSVRKITRPLNVLTDYAMTLADHHFETEVQTDHDVLKISAKSKDEIGNLANAFLHLERMIMMYIQNLKEKTAIQERITSELKIARDIQLNTLPKDLQIKPKDYDFEIAAHLEPAKEVGGDFYDFFLREGRYLILIIGDVSGKGVPAALFMAVTKTLLKAVGLSELMPQRVLFSVNRELCERNEAVMFVTVFYGVLDLKTGHLNYTCAGHPMPLVVRKNEVQELMSTKGMALGVDPDVEFESDSFQMKSGDQLVFVTDGITEAEDGEKNFYTYDRLKTFLGGTEQCVPKVMLDGVLKDLRLFCKDAPQSDDITIMSVKYGGQKSIPAVQSYPLTFLNKLEELQRLSEFVEQLGETLGASPKFVMNLNLVLEELLTNIISYGYQDQGSHEIILNVDVGQDQLKIELIDDGIAFDPLKKERVKIDVSVDKRPIGGLGIHFMKTLMDHCEYRRAGKFNHLILIKKNIFQI